MSGIKTFGADTDLFSTDVIVESGSSGSPVVSLETGFVLGVSTARYDDSDVGLLTNSRDACQISQLMAAGINPSRPRLDFLLLLIEQEPSNVVGQIFSSKASFGSVIRYSKSRETRDPATDGEFEDNLRIFEKDKIEITIQRHGNRKNVQSQRQDRISSRTRLGSLFGSDVY